jgi:hypothetical protein
MRQSGYPQYYHQAVERSYVPPYDEALHPGSNQTPVAAVSADCTAVADARCSLQYRFRTHFHPYVDALVERLVVGSVAGLQGADTEYPQGPLRQRPGTTQVRMEDGLIGILPDGTQIRVAASGGILEIPSSRLLELGVGTEIVLKDPVEITVPDGMPHRYAAGATATIIGMEPERALYDGEFFSKRYHPSELVQFPYPVKEIDFASDGAYAVYNWEVFYHAPLAIAAHLSKNQRFEDAQGWLHYIFDPTDASDEPTPERFWKVKPFQYKEINLIEKVLSSLLPGVDPELRKKTENCIKEWAQRPFRPHLVARFRQTPYMFKAVMAYLDNLIAWGDSLFRQDTRESINEAMQIYVLAAKLLGVRPQLVPKKGSIRPQTYHNLKSDMAKLGVVLAQVETELAYDQTLQPPPDADRAAYLALRSIGRALYFCVPRNDKLIGYWDTVADRLFKIRNSLNIQGIFRQLPLFEPPIDPALLAKAAAAGLDVGAIVSGINQPLPLVRFHLLIQKAMEICQEVKSLGSALLTAIEKEDSEALALLRANHEQIILTLAKTVKYAQWQEAIKSREGLAKSLAASVQRFAHYWRLLDKDDESIKGFLHFSDEKTLDAPSLDGLDQDRLAAENYEQSEGDDVHAAPVPIDNAPDEARMFKRSLTGGKIVSTAELGELRSLEAAQDAQNAAQILDNLAMVFSLIPQFGAEVDPFGVGASAEFGGEQLSKMMSMMANVARAVSSERSHEATRAAKIAGYGRREQEWTHQANLAAGEINQTIKQLRAAQIREYMAKKDYDNHKKQIQQAEEIQQFLKGEETFLGDTSYRRTTTQSFHSWMRRETKGLHGQCFQFAFDVAKKAERALQHELGDPNASFLAFGYLAGKEGLLAGEKLALDIKRMELAYHELNQREYELTKHVSLIQVDPMALMELRATGKCTVKLGEPLFDIDGPGHYFRRIKNVSVSIPCVTGPYTSINCTLTLLKSSIRKTPALLNDQYSRQDDDDRFSDYFGSLQSIVTSSGKHDSGMFETSLYDERVLPFEGSGVISTWELQLPANPAAGERCQFDYDTISDVIIHIRYTAREGGSPLRSRAMAEVGNAIARARAAGSVRLLSMRHDFQTQWASFKDAAPDNGFFKLTLSLREEHFPLWCNVRSDRITGLTLLARTAEEFKVTAQPDEEATAVRIGRMPEWGGYCGGDLEALREAVIPEGMEGDITLYLEGNGMEELWLAIAWGNPAEMTDNG